MTQKLSNQAFIAFVPLMLAFFELAVYLSNDMFLPALPTMSRDFGLAGGFAGFALASWFLGGASMNVLLGPISDRYGRKPVLLCWTFIFAIACFVCSQTRDVNIFGLCRFLQGASVAAVAVCGYATIHELMDDIQAVKAINLMMGITVLGPAFGPVLGGLITSFWEWQRIFLILAIWGAVAWLLLLIALPESHPAERRTSLQVSMIWKSYQKILRSRQFITHTVSAALLFGGAMAWIVSGPFLLIEIYDYSPFQYGLIQLCLFAGFIIGAVFVNRKNKDQSSLLLIRVGLRFSLIGAISGSVFALVAASPLWLFLVSVFVYNIGNGLTFAVFQRSAMAGSDEPSGVKMALFATFMVMFAAFSSMIPGMGLGLKMPISGFMLIAVLGVVGLQMRWGSKLKLE